MTNPRRYPRSRAQNLVLAGLLVAISAAPALAAGGADPLSTAAPTDGSALATLSLVGEYDALQLGAESWIGLHFTIADGWHLYWRNNGDTGAPMQVRLAASPGVTLGDVVYPAPTRLPEPGGFVDFVYEKEVTLLVPVSLDTSIKPGAKVEIKADVDWLICRDMCLAGSGSATLTLPVSEYPRFSPTRSLFTATRARVPAPPPAAAKAGIATAWSAPGALTITAPGAASLTFFPYESDTNTYPQDMAEAGQAEGDSLRLTYNDNLQDADQVGGVLEVRTPDKTSWYEIVVEAPPKGAP